MNFTQESKSQLAKLMATENIIVEHQKIATAMFNLKDRVLYCPIWKDMSGAMYDMLLGHEVGHALETPPEGWHNAVLGAGKFNKNFKHFLNVVEDARIEKKMKRRYPGLRNSFVKAYGELTERDFFGLKGRDVNTMPFIDRLNLYTKGGVQFGIKFTNEEQKLVDQVEGCETWDDVVRVTEAVYEYSKTEQNQIEQQKYKFRPTNRMDDSDEMEFNDSDYGDDDGESEESGDGQESDDGKPTDEESDGDESAKHSSDKSEDGQESDEETEINSFDRDKESKSVWNEELDMDEPVCETDEAFRNNESRLLDEKCKEYVYIDLPTPIMEEILTPVKRVHELMEKHWSGYDNFDRTRTRIYNDFKQKNDRYIGLLAKEFEMRKAASKFAKAKVSESGDIDISRIYKYQVDDNIFRKITKVPKGKSHGLVMMFDRSGSMQYNMASTIEQMMIVAAFCRKVNIPFVVYGFGNNDAGFHLDSGRHPRTGFTLYKNQLALEQVFLREYINSRMGNAEFLRCMKNLALLANSYTSRNSRSFHAPPSEMLSNTPMIEAMVALQPLTKQFREQNKLDIVNMVLLHDGDADSVNRTHCGKFFDCRRQNVVVQDKKEKFQTVAKDMDYDNAIRKAVFDWYSHTTGAKIIGFFITQPGASSIRSSVERRYVDRDGKTLYDDRYTRKTEDSHKAKILTENLVKEIKEKRFLESYNPGYKKFFLIPGGDELSVENESLQIDGTVTAAKLRNAFIKMNKKKQVSRVLVNRFIGEIAV